MTTAHAEVGELADDDLGDDPGRTPLSHRLLVQPPGDQRERGR